MGNTFSCDPREGVYRERTVPRFEEPQKGTPQGPPTDEGEKHVMPPTPEPGDCPTPGANGNQMHGAQSMAEYRHAVHKTVKKAWPLLIAASLRTKVYAFVVPAMTINFFPGHPALAWAVFSVPMIFRPFGGMVFGHIADRYGRKPASKAAVWVVLGAVVAQAFNPSGMIHPGMQSLGTAFLLTARIIQGLGVGGIPAAQTWVTELSDKRCLAMTSAMTQASSNTCYCICAAVLFGLSANLSDDAFNLWGWRVGVLLSGAPEVVALIYMDEVMDTFTPQKIEKKTDR